jgi:hypothetical protein
MKMIHSGTNILTHEFQHFLESRLIEVIKMQMLPSQFVSSMNLIQTQSTEAADLRQNSDLADPHSG